MNWLEEQQQEENEEIYQQNLKQIQQLFPRRQFQSLTKSYLVSSTDFWRIANSLKCPLCQLLIYQPIYLSCSHRFCKECFIKQNASLSDKICPICNTFLESKNFIYQDHLMNLFNQCLSNWFLLLDKKQEMKRQESTLEQNEEKIKLFKSNKGKTVAIKKQSQVIKIKIQDQNFQQIKVDTQTQCCEVYTKEEEVNQKGFEITKSLSIIAHKPRQIKYSLLRGQTILQVKAQPKFIKIRIEKLPSDILSPNLNISQLMINENSCVKIIATLIAQQFNISRKQVYLFSKIRSNFVQLNSKDIVRSKIQNLNCAQPVSRKKFQGLRLTISKFIQNQFTYQNNFRKLREIGTLYFSLRLL